MGCLPSNPFHQNEISEEPLTTENLCRPDKSLSFQFKTMHSLIPGTQSLRNLINHEVLKILSYNILADAYIGNSFSYCEQEFKDFSYRGPKIVKFIETLNPDIFCLQEVDHYNDYYQPFLSKNYHLFQENQDLYLNVGLLIGFKKNAYKFLKKTVICYDNYATEELFEDLKELTKFKKGHRALLLEIESFKNMQKYIIVNTHLHWNPAEEDVKQFQTIQLIKYLENRYEKSQEIIICGDFNSLPDSDQIQFITKPSFFGPENNKMWRICDIKNKKLRFVSSYAKYRQKNKRNLHPSFTNLTANFKGNLDYIFYNKRSKLELKRVLKIPKRKELVALPNKNWSSDHLPIMAEFLIESDIDKEIGEENEPEHDEAFFNL